ncbi:hypothetical protein ACFW9M_24505 [Streptomyces lydicus]|uniref:hypothetical protein n=1 Tax=Streptomyces lydicus TaxID=47763 RepID=UPI00368FB714
MPGQEPASDEAGQQQAADHRDQGQAGTRGPVDVRGVDAQDDSQRHGDAGEGEQRGAGAGEVVLGQCAQHTGAERDRPDAEGLGVWARHVPGNDAAQNPGTSPYAPAEAATRQGFLPSRPTEPRTG